MPLAPEPSASLAHVIAEHGDTLEPVASDTAAWQRWRRYDVAALVEGCFAEPLDPAAIDDAGERAWRARVGSCFASPPLSPPAPRDDEQRLWIRSDDRSVGTIKLSLADDDDWLRIHSLYVLPAARGHGHAARLLDRLAHIAAERGLRGLRLGTCWTWQRALSFYLARGFWVHSWRHDIQLVAEPRLPARRVTIAGDDASLAVYLDGRRHTALRARREGQRLLLEQRDDAAVDRLIGHFGMTTFAVELARAGWPLVRSEATWRERQRWTDAGGPEGLAQQIERFEREAREHGWVVPSRGARHQE